MKPMTFGVVGAGWRAEFFVRLARLLPDQLTLVGVSFAARQLPNSSAGNGAYSPPSCLPPNWSTAGGRTL